MDHCGLVNKYCYINDLVKSGCFITYIIMPKLFRLIEIFIKQITHAKYSFISNEIVINNKSVLHKRQGHASG